MKKIFVAVLVVALALTGATGAFAGIAGTKHDLSMGGGQTVRSTNEAQLCIFCHTPHKSNTTILAAPLWNRTNSTESFTGYSSATTNYTGAAVPGAVSLACLSCHDGAIDEALVNNSGVEPIMNGAAFTNGDLTEDTTISLQNDHPVGQLVNMATIAGLDAGIKSAPVNTNVRLFTGAVECGSCHRVHDNSIAPFLAMSNAGSAMCLTCHNK